MSKGGMSRKRWNLFSWKLLSWRPPWRDFQKKLTLKCALSTCGHVRRRNPWRCLRRRWQGVRMAGLWFCRTECLERALPEILARGRPVVRDGAAAPHRVPLGLLLLSRQQLTGEQLRTALEAQRNAGGGKIGEWLQRLGFSTEREITAALARQWSCPVLRTSLGTLGAKRVAAIPVLLLEAFRMIPVELAEASGTLLMAFSEGIDHTILYAIEQMLGYRTEACLVGSSTLQKGLEALAQHRGVGDVVFDRTEDARECARIIASYSAKIAAEEVRVARCGKHIWIRLENLDSESVNLVLRAPAVASSQFPVLSNGRFNPWISA